MTLAKVLKGAENSGQARCCGGSETQKSLDCLGIKGDVDPFDGGSPSGSEEATPKDKLASVCGRSVLIGGCVGGSRGG